jgi:hypothetical protein
VKSLWKVLRDLLPARLHVQLDHLRRHGRLPRIDAPETFSEKIAYRKLCERDERLPALIDKIEVKETMRARFGGGFVIPTLAVFRSEREIDFAALPYPCAIKASHASGTNLFLRAEPPDKKAALRTLRGYLQYRHERSSEERAYAQVRPRLLVEPLLENAEHGLVDYKFHTFSGRVYAIQVDVDRFTRHRRNFYSPKWERMPFGVLYPQASFDVKPPARLEEMLKIASRIGEDFSYVRVDLYEYGEEVKFGELTFTPGAGLEPFDPPEFDRRFGEQWKLPRELAAQ